MSVTDSAEDQENAKLLQLQSSYWLKRLDHTLTHTQSSSQLIYVVDGAVLALLYFVIQTMEPLRSVIFLSAFPTLLLAILNFLHARLITIQQSWYSAIDAKLRDLLKQGQVVHQQQRCLLSGTHRVYWAIHIVIATFLALASGAMLLHGFGYFGEITIRGKPAANQPAAADGGHATVSTNDDFHFARRG